jgi:hypothetical protein
MTTEDVAIRFTASQALSFCRFIRSRLTSKELEKKLPVRASNILSARASSEPSINGPGYSNPNGLDNASLPELPPENIQPSLWESLPVEFVEKWFIGGRGWVRLISYSLWFFTDTDCQVEAGEL